MSLIAFLFLFISEDKPRIFFLSSKIKLYFDVLILFDVSVTLQNKMLAIFITLFYHLALFGFNHCKLCLC